MSWQKLKTVEGDLPNLIRQVGHEPTRIALGRETIAVSKSGNGYQVKVFGPGGGFCYQETWGLKRVLEFIERKQTEPLRFRRPGD